MKQLPNIITLLRIAGSLGLFLSDVTNVLFWLVYALCGISDIADGWLQLISSLVPAIIAWCYWPGVTRNFKQT